MARGRESRFIKVSILSPKTGDLGGLVLPDALGEVLPKSAANFLVTVAQLNLRLEDAGKQFVLSALRRPAITLMSRSPSFTNNVLRAIFEFLQTESDPVALRPAKERVSFVQIVLEIVKTEKLERSLATSRDIVKPIMQTVEAQEDTQTSKGRELKRLHEQLQTASGVLFGSGFLS